VCIHDFTFQEQPNEISGKESDNDDDVELPLTTLVQATDTSVQVLRKYVREQPDIPEDIVTVVNAIENFTDRSS